MSAFYQITMQELDYNLNRLHGRTFADAKQISESLRSLLLEDLPEHHLCYALSRVFASPLSLLRFCDGTVTDNDKLYRETRVNLYSLIEDIVRKYPTKLDDYVQLLRQRLFVLFRQEQLSRPKEAALGPLLKLTKIIRQIGRADCFKPKELCSALLDQVKFCKPSPSVRGMLWHLLGVLVSRFPELVEDKAKLQIQQNCLAELKLLFQGDKNQTVAIRLVKSFKYSLDSSALSMEQMDALAQHVVAMAFHATPQYCRAALSIITKQSAHFERQLIINAQPLIEALIAHMSAKSAEVKEKASFCLETVLGVLVRRVAVPRCKELFVETIRKLWVQLKQLSGPREGVRNEPGKLIALIKIIGSTAETIREVLGNQELLLLFCKLLEHSSKKTIRSFAEGEEQTQFRFGLNFKTVLYRQKQVCAFIAAFARIVSALQKVEESHCQQLLEIALLSVRLHRMFYEKYLDQLYNALVALVAGLEQHPQISLLWTKKFVALALKESVERQFDRPFSPEDHYRDIAKASKLWAALLLSPLWPPGSSEYFQTILLNSFSDSLSELDFSSMLLRDEANQGSRCVPTNPFHYEMGNNLSLLLSDLLLVLPLSVFFDRVPSLYSILIAKSQKYPRSVPILRLLRCLHCYCTGSRWFQLAPQHHRTQIERQLQKYLVELFRASESYHEELLFQTLKVLVLTPPTLLAKRSVRLLALECAKTALHIGGSVPSLAFAVLQLFRGLVSSFGDKEIRQELGSLVPLLGGYLHPKDGREDQFLNLTLRQHALTSQQLSRSVKDFLGEIGGQAHFVVPSLRGGEGRKAELIAWDYDAKLTLELSLLSKRLEVNIVSLLPRALELALHSDTQTAACEFVHSIMVYTIGKVASQPKGQDQQLKQSCAAIYRRLLPVLLQIAVSPGHSCSRLINLLLLQFVHFLANTHQPDSPDVLVLVEVLSENLSSSKQLADLAAYLYGEFIRWNIKQQAPGTKDWPVVKASLRGIWSLLSSRQTRGGLVLLLSEVLSHIQAQPFLLSAYALEMCLMALAAAKREGFQVDLRALELRLARILREQQKVLAAPFKHRKGRFQTIQQFAEHLYRHQLFGEAPGGRAFAWALLQDILKGVSLGQDSLLSYLLARGDKRRLVLLPQITLTSSSEALEAQVEMWLHLLEGRHLEPEQVVKLHDFSDITMVNVRDYMRKLAGKVEAAEFLELCSDGQRLGEPLLRPVRTLAKLQVYCPPFFDPVVVAYLLMDEPVDGELQEDLIRVLKKLASASGQPLERMLDVEKAFKRVEEQNQYRAARILAVLKECEVQGRVGRLFDRILGGEGRVSAEKRRLVFQFCIEKMEGAELYVFNSIEVHSLVFQNHEREVLKYLLRRWDYLGSQFVRKALTFPSFSKLLLMVLAAPELSPAQVAAIANEIATLPFDAKSCEELIDLFKLNYSALMQLKGARALIRQKYVDYLVRLVEKGLGAAQAALLIEPFNLLGLLLALFPARLAQFDARLKALQLRYFPPWIKELETKDATEFHVAFKCFSNLVRLSGQVGSFTYFVGLIREPLTAALQARFRELVLEFGGQWFKRNQGECLTWLWEHFLRDSHSHYRFNTKQGLVTKLLCPLLKEADPEELVLFLNRHAPLFFEVLEAKFDLVSSQAFLLDLLRRRLVLHVIDAVYQGLPLKADRPQLHADDKLYKRLIALCWNWVKKELQGAALAGEELEGGEQVRLFLCSCYNLLCSIFIATQSNPDQFGKFLFLRQQGEHLFDRLVPAPTVWPFLVETNFEEVEDNVPLVGSDASSKVLQRYCQSTLFLSQGEASPSVPEQKEEARGHRQKLQLDVVNRIQIMRNMLRVIDHLHAKFPGGEEPPLWMNNLLRQCLEASLHVRIFITKLLVNRPHVFVKYARIWGPQLLVYCSLPDNGAKLLHYFLRDALSCLVRFAEADSAWVGARLEERRGACALADRLVRMLVSDNSQIYSENISLLRDFMRVFKKTLSLDHKLLARMAKSDLKKATPPDQPSPLAWRLNAFICLYLALEADLSFASSYDQQLKLSPQELHRFLLLFQEQHLLDSLFELGEQTQKRFHRTLGAVCGALLSAVHRRKELGEAWQQCYVRYKRKIVVELTRLNTVNNRNSRQKFPLVIEEAVKRHPALGGQNSIFDQLDRLSTFLQKQDLAHVFNSLAFYFKASLEARTSLVTHLQSLCVSLRASSNRLLQEGDPISHSAFLGLLEVISAPACLDLCPQVSDFFTTFLGHARTVFLKLKDEQLLAVFFGVVIRVYQHCKAAGGPLTQVSRKTLVAGVTCSCKIVRQTVFKVLDQEHNYNPFQRLAYCFTDLFLEESQQSWLISAGPLLLALFQRSADYERRLFDQPLDQLTKYYDWDFRNPVVAKQYNPSQPQFGMSLSLSQDGFTTSFSGLVRATAHGLPPPSFLEPEGPRPRRANQMFDILKGEGRRHNRLMSSFYASNQLSFSQLQLTSGNYVRFNNASRPKQQQHEFHKELYLRSKKNVEPVRKYRFGELPDIQIKVRDVLDPMLSLAFADELFAGQVLVSFAELFSRLEGEENAGRLKGLVGKLLERCTNYNLSSFLLKALFRMSKQSGEFERLDYGSIARRTNCYDLAILLVEEGLFVQGVLRKEGREVVRWMELLEMYSHMLEEDNVKGILMRTLPEPHRDLLAALLENKAKGKLLIARNAIEDFEHRLRALAPELEQQEVQLNEHVQRYLEKERRDCQLVLLQWDRICEDSAEPEALSLRQRQALLTALLHQGRLPAARSLTEGWADGSLSFEAAMVPLYSFLKGESRQLDTTKYQLSCFEGLFLNEWPRLGPYASGKKHQLVQQLQKAVELKQFLEAVGKGLGEEGARRLFAVWERRRPSYIFDEHLSWVQVLECRLLYSRILKQLFGLGEDLVGEYSQRWLVQMADGMLKKGQLGAAEPLVRKALVLKREQHRAPFMWEFFKSTLKLQLFKLQRDVWPVEEVRASSPLQMYERVLALTEKEMGEALGAQRPKYELMRLRYYSSFAESYRLAFEECGEGFAKDYCGVLALCFRKYSDLLAGQQFKLYEDSLRYKYLVRFTEFCEKVLRTLRSGNGSARALARQAPPQHVAATLISCTVRALRLVGAQRGVTASLRSLVLKSVKVVQANPQELGPAFRRALGEDGMPLWVFLGFIPQMITALAQERLAPHFLQFFEYAATNHPEVLVYQLNTQCEFEQDCRTEQALGLFKYMRQNHAQYFQFIHALNCLTHPESRLISYLEELKGILDRFPEAKTPQEKALLKNAHERELQRIHRDFLAQDAGWGRYNKAFAQEFGPKLSQLDRVAVDSLLTQLRAIKIASGRGRTSDFHLYFEEYTRADLVMPGRRDPRDRSVQVAGFGAELLVMGSIRRPKRLRTWGSDEKEYLWLCKGCEDLRLDQRVEQIFEVMNGAFEGEAQCLKRELNLSTFTVVPMSRSLGLLEWVRNTKVLKEILEQEARHHFIPNLLTDNPAYHQRAEFLRQIAPAAKSLQEQHQVLLYQRKDVVVAAMRNQEGRLPKGLLRGAFEKMAMNLEAYLHLKARFVRNYAMICVGGYLLGIGDRHLENFLVNYGNGEIVGIDFGCSFGAGVGLFLPELVPFRLTRVLREMTLPVGEHSVFQQSMAHALVALRKQEDRLMDYCEVFITDPVLDWVRLTRGTRVPVRLPDSQPSASASLPHLRAYSRRVQIVKNKLRGLSPRLLMAQELEDSRHRGAGYYQGLRKGLVEGEKNRVLSPEEQAHSLIQMAMDPNLYGRIWVGWCPFV